MSSNIETLAKEIGNLSKLEKENLMKRLIDKMSNEEIMQLLEKATDNAELMAMLKTIEPMFDDWDNDEDDVYDKL